MFRAPLAVSIGTTLVLATACATVADGERAAEGPAAPPDWKATMRAVDAQFQIVDEQLRQPQQGDLEAAAKAARTAAALVAAGYGRHERDDVPGFAAMARACESWLLAIALEADQGHGEIAREQLGKAERCVECHNASGKRQW